MQIREAHLEDLDLLAPLFDAYRVFYNQESDTNAAKLFLSKRIVGKQSIILLALDNDKTPLGFTQLYPSFSSVALKRVYILNDLFVTQEARGRGVGEALLDAAKQVAKNHGARGLVLETARDNPAQKLYEKNGWTKDSSLHYYWEV
ncbi:MAG: GNAT family N-acetyltransferase [Gilvibacter sp.]